MNSAVSNNIGDLTDGAMLIYNSNDFEIKRCTISNNTSFLFNGGVGINSGFQGEIYASTFSANTGQTGGLLVRNNNSIYLTGNTFANNMGESQGGAIYLSNSIVSLRGNLVTGNRAPQGAEIDSTGTTFLAIDQNLFGDGGQTSATAFRGVSPPPGTNVIATSDSSTPASISSLIEPLADNGGLTRTHLPKANSLARHGVTNTMTCNGNDQRGFERGGVPCDIGAVELLPRDETQFFVIPAKNGKVAIIEL